ncbi:response regulator transcription factor [Bartonella sp. HY329]|uniref:LuxR C-terminal-related transcriptional regulator n=1 Tax=unclassified Bartonella TaxID=2645622 RepID=UPI0021C7B6D5|nr:MULTISPECIES: response regulator transcription factor [unclassified Bartonella]UXM96302.1 response regulator transcription factor [Bartonella sp. HY329]UXN10626.1 response regulator transcription factor [Bartonella sp. HY328]
MVIQTIAADLTLEAPVLLVEDDPMVYRRIKTLLLAMGYDEQAIVHASSLSAARQSIKNLSFIALALVDLGLPDGNGIDLISELRTRDINLGILVISAWSTQDVTFAALRAGATGYIVKERDDLEIALALRSILRGGAPIDPFIARRIINELPLPKVEDQNSVEIERLSPREHEILVLVAQGLGNREIADQLSLSRYTVESHIKHIYRKLAVSSRTKAINTARRRGLIC